VTIGKGSVRPPRPSQRAVGNILRAGGPCDMVRKIETVYASVKQRFTVTEYKSHISWGDTELMRHEFGESTCHQSKTSLKTELVAS